MNKYTLKLGSSEDSLEVQKILLDKNVEFGIEYSEDNSEEVVLVVETKFFMGWDLMEIQKFVGLNLIKEHFSHFAGEEVLYKNFEIEFFPSKHLKSSSDLWKLEFLLGSENVYNYLKQEKVINYSVIQNLFKSSVYKFFVDKSYSILSASNNELVSSKLGKLIELNMFKCLEMFGINKM